MKLRKGMRVNCSIEGKEIKNAMLQEEGGSWYLCQNDKNGSSCKNKLGMSYSWVFGEIEDGKYGASVNWIKTANSTDIKNLYEGAKVDKDRDVREVLGICGKVVFLSCITDLNEHGTTRTIEELKRAGYTLVPEVVEEEKMIDIDGEKWSESTIKEALRDKIK